ncbi:MAG: heat-inducible transcriptional repressor HrcA [Actinomycetia bacterium]|nr:heat-inducible transcriptional repressor HrcA [Actinomycetes bacterium]
MSDERRLDVLRAIVADFVATHEPVGSKSLVERHELGVSSATVRNDMAVLEEDGYIVQPHTSAGRIPTDKGYRLFVDRLTGIRPVSRAERRAIRTFLDSAVDLDNVVDRTVRLLSDITRQVAMVQYPSLSRSRIRHVELVELGNARLLVIVIADTGRVEQRVLELPDGFASDLISDLHARINDALVDREFAEVSGLTDQVAAGFTGVDDQVVRAVLGSVQEAATEEVEERIVIGGTANLARETADLPHSVHPILEALEEHVVLLRLLGETTATDEVSVRIGHENDVVGMNAASVVSVGYGPDSSALAHLGVVGPTRMDYAGNIAAVRAVARYLGRVLADQ